MMVCFLVALVVMSCEGKNTKEELKGVNNQVGNGKIDADNKDEITNTDNTDKQEDSDSQNNKDNKSIIGSLKQDFNNDGTEDIINVSRPKDDYFFELQLSGKNVLKDSIYDYRENGEIQFVSVDLNTDGNDEMVFLFESTIQGGEGAYELVVIADTVEGLVHVELPKYFNCKGYVLEESSFDKIASVCSYQMIDSVSKVEVYENNLITWQYISGEDGHADKVGYVLTRLSMEENETLKVENSRVYLTKDEEASELTYEEVLDKTEK